MVFRRKMFEDARAVILSEKPLWAAQFEERMASLVPAFESTLDSFETYLSAYEHCSENKKVGMFYLHFTDTTRLPTNAIDECASPFESIGCSAGLYIIAETEKAFASAYKVYGQNPRLLKIVLESDLSEDQSLKNCILESWKAFENLQKSTALPADELDFITKLTSRFTSIEPLIRATQILSAKLDKNWYEDLLLDVSPVLLAMPTQQKWVLNNSKSLQKINEILEPYTKLSPNEVILSKNEDHAIRAAVLAHCIFMEAAKGNVESIVNELTQGANAFSPTLKKILQKEKMNILELFAETKGKVAI